MPGRAAILSPVAYSIGIVVYKSMSVPRMSALLVIVVDSIPICINVLTHVRTI
ncbi:hypothetical protein KKI24_30710 [bacterium]|nr:hypothetical protein [bacterium]